MLEIRLINNYIMTQFLLADPQLIAMSLCDEALKDLDAGLGYTSPVPTILGIYQDGELVCCFLLSLLTNVTYEGHIFMGTKWHHTGLGRKINEALKQYLKENTNCKKLMSLAPVACTHVHNALLHSGFKLAGTIPDGMIWREVLQDINIYYEEI